MTDDEVLGRDAFATVAGRLLGEFGAQVALHVRGHGTGGRRLFELTDRLLRGGGDAVVLVNDRVDVALAVGAPGVQLGRRSLPVGRVRQLLGEAVIGYSAHDPGEAEVAFAAGTDFVLLGTIFATTSHPGWTPVGVASIRVVAGRGRPVLGIGGITPERVPEVRAAGAHGVAVLSGVWLASDPVDAVHRYLTALAT